MDAANVTIVDYGAGNIRSVVGALSAIGVASTVEEDPERIRKARLLVLPGVGSFKTAMVRLDTLGLSDALRDSVASGAMVLGVCLGMQLLGEWSAEESGSSGIGLAPGESQRFSQSGSLLRIPHMGFNSVYSPSDSILFRGIPDGGDFYFAHSYRISEDAKWLRHHPSQTNYGGQFVSAYEVRECIFGVQFHPELSQGNGLQLLSNFVRHASC